jgi:hypothetical protein
MELGGLKGHLLRGLGRALVSRSLSLFTALLIFILGSTPLSAADHVIYYDPAYADEAFRLEALCEEFFGIDTEAVDINFTHVFDGGTGEPIVYGPISTAAGDTERATFFAWLRGDLIKTIDGEIITGSTRAEILEPFTMRVGFEFGRKADYITLLGNPTEVPPSAKVNDFYDTDYYYSLDDQSAWLPREDALDGFPTATDPSSYIPISGISRIPSLVKSADDVTEWVVDTSNPSSSIINLSLPVGSVLARNELVDERILVTVAFEAPAPYKVADVFYPTIQGHTGVDADGKVKVILTEMITGGILGGQTFSLEGADNFPYLIRYSPVEGLETLRGAFAYMDPTFFSVVDVYESLFIGQQSFVVSNAEAELIIEDIFLPPRIQLMKADSKLQFQDLVLAGGNTNQSLGDEINSGDRSIIMVMKSGAVEGRIYPIIGYEVTELDQEIFQIDQAVADSLPISNGDIEGASFFLYDLTGTRDEIKSTFAAVNPLNPNPETVLYVEPANLRDPATGNSRVTGEAYTFDLKDSVTQYVDKVEAWVDYVWDENEGKSDYFHQALMMAQSSSNRWDYPNEQTLVNILNSRDGQNATNPSIFNGFRIQKVLHSNDGEVFAGDSWSDRLRPTITGGLGNQAFLDAMDGKGLLFMVGPFENSFGASSEFSPLFFPTNTSGEPLLPLLINAGAAAYNPLYSGINFVAAANIEELSLEELEIYFDLPADANYVANYVMDGINSDGRDFRGLIAQIGDWGAANGSDGFLDKGFLSPFPIGQTVIPPSHELGKEALREYTSADQPKLGSVWRESVINYVRNKSRRDRASVQRSDLDEVAIEVVANLETWGSLGMAAMALPPHLQYQPTNTVPPLADEVPQPLISLESPGARVEAPYDRYETPIIEVPSQSDKSGNVTVSVTVTNMENEENADGIITSLGFTEYNPDIRFRVSLVVLPLDQPYQDATQYPMRISEMDFSGLGTPEPDQVFEVQVGATGQNVFEFEFNENWESNGLDVTKRGPGLFMVKVEAEERARPSGDIYESQKAASFTKENRIFFKIVNEFKGLDKDSNGDYVRQPETPFLLVNNTDHDPYMQAEAHGITVSDGGAYLRYAPSAAIRFYEDAMDNYQYSRGTLSTNTSYIGNTGIVKLLADDPDSMFWQHRVFPGDKIRVLEDDSVSYGPWFRVTDVASDGSYLEVLDRQDGGQFFFTTGSFSSCRYVIQRSYTFGYAEMNYTWVDLATAPVISRTITISIPDLVDKGFDDVVQVGDFFKFLDGRVFGKISSVGSAVVNGDRNDYVIVLEEEYPYETIYHYHSLNSEWGGADYLQVGGGTMQGSFAIYPPDDNDPLSEEPSYLYRTWNVHNYVTTNDEGLGVHGDVTTGVLDSYSASIDGVVHSALVWANDLGYGVARTLFFPKSNRDLVGFTETEIYPGDELFYLSDRDLTLLSGYMGQGGRILTGGAFVYPRDDAFFTDTLGLVVPDGGITAIDLLFSSEDAGGSGAYKIIVKEDNDPISNAFENEVSLDIGAGESTGLDPTVEDELLKTHFQGQLLLPQVGKSLPVFNPTGQFSGLGSAMVRSSGGPNPRPWAAAFMGFDFSNVSYSGVHSEFADLSDDSVFEGRNLLMKKSLDWLRDPSRTAADQQPRLTYFALNQDGTKSSVVLDLAVNNVINDALHASFQSEEQLTGVGPNQELSFSVTGGEIYDRTGYTWNIIGQSGDGGKAATWERDQSEEDNDDNHKIVFTTGDSSSGEYRLQLVTPDDGVHTIIIQTARQPLFFTVVNDDVLVINDRTMWEADAQVDFLASGGDGLGSYTFSISPGDPSFTNNASLLEGSAIATYTIPNVQIDAEVQVPLLARSGSVNETATLTILPPLRFSSQENLTHVIGGDPANVSVVGGTGLEQGYEFSTTDLNVILEVSTDGTGVGVSIDPTAGTASEDPSNPSTVTIVASDRTFLEYPAISTSIDVFAAPRILYEVGGGVFATLEDQTEITVDDSGVVPLKVVGGSGNFTVRVAGVGGGYGASTNILRRTEDGGGELEASKDDKFTLPYTEKVSLELIPGNVSGTVTLEVVSGGSTLQVTVELTVPLVAELQLPDANSFTFAGDSVDLPGLSDNVTDFSLAISLTDGSPPFTIASTGLEGGFLTQSEYDVWELSKTGSNPSNLSASTNIGSLNDQVFFFTANSGAAGGQITVIEDDTLNQIFIPISVEGGAATNSGGEGTVTVDERRAGSPRGGRSEAGGGGGGCLLR